MKYLLLFIASAVMADITATATLTEDKSGYEVIIKETEKFRPEAKVIVPRPDKEFIFDSFQNDCVVFEVPDRKPAANAKVIAWSDDGWRVESITDFAGCWSSKLPSESTYYIKIQNPQDNMNYVTLDGKLTTGEPNKLNHCEQSKMLPTGLPNLILTTTWERNGAIPIKLSPTDLRIKFEKAPGNVFVKIKTIPGHEYIVKFEHKNNHLVTQKLIFQEYGTWKNIQDPKVTTTKGKYSVGFIAKTEETAVIWQQEGNVNQTTEIHNVSIKALPSEE